MESKIQVYPNPAQNLFTIELPQKKHDLEISDMTGRKVYSQKNVSGKIEVDCSNFQNGIYVIQASTSKSSFFQKIIINN